MQEETQKAHLEQHSTQKMSADISLQLSLLTKGKAPMKRSTSRDEKGPLPTMRTNKSLLPTSAPIDNPLDPPSPSLYWSCLLPKMDLPMFEGDDPVDQLTKYCQYFLFFEVTTDWKVPLVSLFLTDLANVWYQNWSPPTCLLRGQTLRRPCKNASPINPPKTSLNYSTR